MAVSAPAPAPLPTATLNTVNQIVCNSDAYSDVSKVPSVTIKNRYFIHTSRSKHTQRYVLGTHLKTNYNLSPIHYGFLPNKYCIFFWIQLIRYDDINNALSLSIKNNIMPCISFVPTQGMLCEKTRFALTLYKYYGNNAWKYTPQTFHACYNRHNKKWNLSEHNLNNVFINKENVWITKTSTGSSGKNMYLFTGNSLNSLQLFLKQNYSQKMERNVNKSKRFKYLENYEKYINPNAHILLDSVIIQKYLNKPLLFDKFYKFDIRIYALLASTNPCILFYRLVKLRVCASKYDDLLSGQVTDKKALSAHISNSTMSRGNKAFDPKTSTINGRATLSDYNGFVTFMYDMAVINKHFSIQWFETDKYKQLFMQNKLTLNDIERIIDIKFSEILSAVYDAAKQSFDNDSKLYKRPCQFLLQGNDIMIDECGKFWMLEINQTPTMFKDHDQNIKNLMKNIVTESIDIVMEIRELKLSGYTVNQYTSLKTPRLWKKGHLHYKNAPIQIVNAIINDIDVFLND